MNGNTRVQPKEAEPQTPSLSNAGLRRLRRRTTQAGREEPKRAGGGNIRSRGAPEAVADLRAKAAAAAEDDPPIPTRRHRGCRVLLPPLAAAPSRRDQLSGKRHGPGSPESAAAAGPETRVGEGKEGAARGSGGGAGRAREQPNLAESCRASPRLWARPGPDYGSRGGPRGGRGAARQAGRVAAAAQEAAAAGPRSGGDAGGGGGPGGRGPGPRGGGSGGGGGRMIKLFSLKQQKKEEESAGGTKGSSKKASAAQLRIQKDINELNLPKTCDISFSDPDDLLNFKLVICPDEGFYKSGKFVFSFKVGQGYPHDPPKVKCETMVYHPNIDLEGNVCLNILREDWKPVLTINSIIYGLQYLFLEPNPEDPLNKEAAEVLQNNRRLFEQNVQRSMRGGYIGSTYFERCLK
ncbi:NEDD8-conjugating enzyme Ubc12 [Macaca thibetana thibetana]|uniref:NEDD8-conjugating enzyme Ubc12 n=1 Tax=Macaca thibetana thibetana TaxID=257877 RepID=UPI0021BC39B7|nr:NEDD8-conjugating enzyme Ubc12 [Macaca thibetana thibetana]